MELGIEGKVAIITGGAGDLGKVLVKAFLGAGAKVGIVDNDDARLAVALEEFSGAGARVHGVKADISNTAQVNAAVAEIAETLGPISILVNNAARLADTTRIENITDEKWERFVSVNLTGTFKMTRACLPSMQKQGWGRLIAVSSVAGVQGGYGQGAYASTKAAVIALMKTAALENGRNGIAANAVYPGLIGTEALKGLLESEDEDWADQRKRLELMLRSSVLRQPVDPEEVADAILFLCSERVHAILGTALDLTGGMELFVFETPKSAP